MKVLRPGLRIGVVVALVAALLVVWSAVRTGAADTGSGPYRHGIVVVGDSITARYDDDPGSEAQGWWSMVGRHFDAPVRTYAQSGSGYQRPGLRCTGNEFVDRPQALRRPAPSVFIVEGGRNDWARCVEGRFVRASDARVERAVTRYLTLVKTRMPRSTRIVVLGPPWGPLDPWEGRRITSIVHAAADRLGLEYVDTTGTLDSWDHVVDGIHPNRAGSTRIADRVIADLSKPRSAS
ncbi:MAG: SGNH/GDSL hydrolase family protein [Aeromicrobium erythreum]